MNETRPKAVMPMINVESVDLLRSFYVDKLGFTHLMGVVGKDGEFDFCTVVRDGAQIMLMRPQEPVDGTRQGADRRPVELYVEVGDVDAFYSEVKERGVRIASPLETQWWGDRTFTITDPYGYVIWFYQPVGEPQPPQGMKIV